MLKQFIVILSALFIIPAYAGELEDALTKGKPVFLYMYTNECGYCQRFAPIYDKVSRLHDESYTFLKIDANTMYGYKIMRSYKARYVPFVIIINPKTKEANQIPGGCILKTECVDKVLKDFRK